MKKASPLMRKIAERLLEIEGASGAADEDAFLFPAGERLRPHLANLMGQGGVRALFARSFVLASTEVPWLRAAYINGQGHLDGLEAAAIGLEPARLLEGRVAILAHVIGLLVAFIGPSLTTSLIGEIWPQIPLGERSFGNEDYHEKAR
jgi:hypothetical protein